MKDNRDDTRFMKMAIDKAKEGIGKGQTPFGACIVKDGKVVVCVHNIVWDSTDITAHAEVNAIRQACKKLRTIDLSGCIIYSTCEPCPMCFAACHWAKLSGIIYGSSIEDAARFGFKELKISSMSMKKIGKSPVRVRGGFLRQENIRLFETWSTRKDKRIY